MKLSRNSPPFSGGKFSKAAVIISLREFNFLSIPNVEGKLNRAMKCGDFKEIPAPKLGVKPKNVSAVSQIAKLQH